MLSIQSDHARPKIFTWIRQQTIQKGTRDQIHQLDIHRINSIHFVNQNPYREPVEWDQALLVPDPIQNALGLHIALLGPRILALDVAHEVFKVLLFPPSPSVGTAWVGVVSNNWHLWGVCVIRWASIACWRVRGYHVLSLLRCVSVHIMCQVTLCMCYIICVGSRLCCAGE